MTLIECFDHTPLENITACLTLKPQRLILIGEEERMRRPAEALRRLLQERGIDTEILLRGICKDDLEDTVAVLTDIVQTEGECVFDVTGGAETVLLAVGAVYVTLKDRYPVRVWRSDVYSGEIRDCGKGNAVIGAQPASLSVSELITLHGGTSSPAGKQPTSACTTKDIAQLWELICDDPRNWNRSITVFNEFENRSIDRNHIYLQMNALSGTIANFTSKEPLFHSLLEKLRKRGLIEDRSHGSVVSYRYRDPLIRYCLEKAGNVLEIKALLEARELTEGGAPFFSDCRMSVTIDWDSVARAADKPAKDTRNEIDLMLMRGLTPVFVSCKNGGIEEEELYKLHTVAERFGGKYARKMLIATDFDRKNASSTAAFVRRAQDMGIFLVTDADELDKDGWAEIFKKATRGGTNT